MCAFIWCANGIETGPEIRNYQDALIEEVFGYGDKTEFIKGEKRATEVSTWDGRYRGYMSHEHLQTMAKWVCIIGPFAAMYGRDIEQYLMRPERNLFIPEWDFNNSVDGVK